MGKKVIRLTESDLKQIVKRVVAEQSLANQGMKSPTLTIKTAKTNYPLAKNRSFKVREVMGKPSISKNGKDLLITNGMKITPQDLLKFKQGDKLRMSSISSEDAGKYFQDVQLELGPNGRLDLFVYSN